jgi:hypothetical protein
MLNYSQLTKQTLFLKENNLHLFIKEFKSLKDKSLKNISFFEYKYRQLENENDLLIARFRGNQAGLRSILEAIINNSALTIEFLENLYRTICMFEYHDRFYQHKICIPNNPTYHNEEVQQKFENTLKIFNAFMSISKTLLTKKKLFFYITEFVEAFLTIQPYTHANTQIAMHLLNFLLLKYEIGFCPLGENHLIKNNILQIDAINDKLFLFEVKRDEFVFQLLNSVKKIDSFEICPTNKNSIWNDDNFEDKEDDDIILYDFISHNNSVNTYAKLGAIKEVNNLIKINTNPLTREEAVDGYFQGGHITKNHILQLLSLTDDTSLREMLADAAKILFKQLDTDYLFQTSSKINQLMHHSKISFNVAAKRINKENNMIKICNYALSAKLIFFPVKKKVIKEVINANIINYDKIRSIDFNS